MPQLPPAFVERMTAQLGEEYAAFEKSLNTPRITSLRFNPEKPRPEFENSSPVPWCEAGVYLKERPLFAGDPHIFAGAYYVQEASSMFLWKALKEWGNLEQPLKVLDLCASPGGKSSLISSLLPEGSLLVSNELVSKRVGALMENLTRWGKAHHVVTSNHSGDFNSFREFFDIIVVDAPCSGEGMFRKDPKAIEQWSEGLVKSCQSTQRQILEDILPCLKGGGLLCYSTCTYAPEEDEEQISWMLDTQELQGLRLEQIEEFGIVESSVKTGQKEGYGYRFYPHRTQGEGFFLAGFRKLGEGGKPKMKKLKKMRAKLEPLPKKYNPIISPWLEKPEKWEYLVFQEHIFAVPNGMGKDAQALAAIMNVCMFGVKLGRINGKKFIPDHHLAVSTLINSDLPRLDLSWEQAISYLQKKEFNADTQEIEGWALASYEGNALGWLKVLPNRINNFYPSGLRLKREEF